MSAQHLACIIASTVGGVAAGAMGLDWLQSPPLPASSSLGVETSEAAAWSLVAALLAAIVGCSLLLLRRNRAAAIVLFTAGLVPGLLDPRAFVVTFLLVFAGLIAPRHLSSRFV